MATYREANRRLQTRGSPLPIYSPGEGRSGH